MRPRTHHHDQKQSEHRTKHMRQGQQSRQCKRSTENTTKRSILALNSITRFSLTHEEQRVPFSFEKSTKLQLFRERATVTLASFHVGLLSWLKNPRSKKGTSNKLNSNPHIAPGRSRTQVTLVGGERSRQCAIFVSTQHKMFCAVFSDFVYRRLCVRFGSLSKTHALCMSTERIRIKRGYLIYLGTQTLADFLDNDTCKGTADQND